jgi:peroxiredoxin
MALLQVGAPAPSFKGQNLTGPEFQLENVKGKKPVIIIFPPDQINPVQTNQTKSVYDKNRNDVEFVVMTRKVPSVAMAKAFLAQFNVKFPVVYDPKQDIYRLYGVEKPIVIYAINTAGVIADALELDPKALSAAQIEGAIAKAKTNHSVP